MASSEATPDLWFKVSNILVTLCSSRPEINETIPWFCHPQQGFYTSNLALLGALLGTYGDEGSIVTDLTVITRMSNYKSGGKHDTRKKVASNAKATRCQLGIMIDKHYPTSRLKVSPSLTSLH